MTVQGGRAQQKQLLITPPTEDPFRAAAAKARSVQAEVLEVNERRARFNQVDGDRNGKLDANEVKALLNLETESEARAVIQEVQ